MLPQGPRGYGEYFDLSIAKFEVRKDLKERINARQTWCAQSFLSSSVLVQKKSP